MTVENTPDKSRGSLPQWTADLAGPIAPCIDEWLPGETLFSLASRHHAISGNTNAAQTCAQLFGHKRIGSAHDFPARMNTFVERTSGLLGSAIEIIRDRTVLDFYLRFRSPDEQANLIASARLGGIGASKGRLGLLASRLGAAHPLKACERCMMEDLDAYQTTYWHLEHQWPSTWLCSIHREPLAYALVKTNSEGRFSWHLPDSSSLTPGIQKATFMDIEPYLQALADCGRGLITMPREAALTSARLEIMYMQRMRQLGLANARGRVAWPELNQCVAGVVERLQEVPALAALGRRSTQGQILISRAVGPSRGAAHPLNHFTLVLTLYHQWEHFVAAYAAPIEANIPEIAGSTNSEIERRMSEKRQVVVSAVRHGHSVLAAARESNVAVATAMAWVAATGLVIQRRPKKLTAKLRAVAIRSLERGAEKRAVADSIKMSVQTVTLLLRTEVGLHGAWTKARFSKAQRHARHTWKHSAEALSRPTPRLLRSLQPAAYAWLYRNDRAWLQSYGSQLERAARSNNSKLNWDARDRALAQTIREAALALFETEARPRIRLSTLCNAVPTLKARLSSLRKLPLTQREIAIFLNRRIGPV